ncbi:hypothetical protein ACP4OV_013109 [Aristida adscensionis]
MMESEAIPCAHIFCVMRYVNLDDIPPCCVSVRWRMEAKKAFPTELGTNTLVWSEQMERFHALRNKSNYALFKASRSETESERVMHFLDEVIARDVENTENTEASSFGPMPAHFFGASRPSTSNVLDPKKIISKGAPSMKKRWKAYLELWRTN